MYCFVVYAVLIALPTSKAKDVQCNGKSCSTTITNDDIPSNCVPILLPLLCRIDHPCCSYKDHNISITRTNARRKCDTNYKKCARRGGVCVSAKGSRCRTTKVSKLCKGKSCACCVGNHEQCTTTPECRFQGGYCFRGNSKVYCPSDNVLRRGCEGKKCSCCFKKRKCKCGKERKRTRIIGGEQVKPKFKYPWMVGIKIPIFLSDSYLCGGSIINDLYIVTAAHCVENVAPTNVFVGLADYKQSTSGDDKKGVTDLVGVRKIILHNKYLGETFDYDIGLLKLKKRIDLSSNREISSVCLPTNASKTYEGETGIAYGWGVTEPTFQQSNALKETAVPIVDPGCKGTTVSPQITPQMLCAGFKKGGKDTCAGDSGGPLTVIENGRHVLVGITSFGNGCAERNSPGVYTRVTSMLKWIIRNTKDANYCN